MVQISLNDAEGDLLGLISRLAPGEEVLIVESGRALARIKREMTADYRCKAGSAKDTIHWMADDFDAPLVDFREYME